MSKAKRIMELLAAGERPGEIARKLGVNPAYIDIVRKRHEGQGYRSASDRRYEATHVEELRAANRERVRRWREKHGRAQ